MIIVVGLVVLVAALVVGVAGVLGNGGSAHPLAHFSVLGYHVQGSAGTLFLSGIVVGAAGLLGLTLLLAGARRTSRRGREARVGLRQSRREAAIATKARDDLIDQQATARADAVRAPENGTIAGDDSVEPISVEPISVEPIKAEPIKAEPIKTEPSVLRGVGREWQQAMTTRQVARRTELITARAKSLAGRVSGNRHLQAEGRRGLAKGGIGRASARVKDALLLGYHRAADRLGHRTARR